MLAGFAGKRWTHQRADMPDPKQAEAIAEFNLTPAYGRDGVGLGNPLLHWGNNSGYQAVNLAYLLGADQIVLLGYDMQHSGGKKHFFGEHPAGLNSGHQFDDWIWRFRRLAEDLAKRDVQVLNASRETALDCVPRVNLADVL